MTTAFWRRLDTPGHDHARLGQAADGWTLTGVALFLHQGKPARLDYHIDLARDWATRSARIASLIDRVETTRRIDRVEGRWRLDGQVQPGLDDLLHLDLGFTPATNLQQLRRAALDIGATADIPAAWLDVDGGLSRLDQTYRRTAERAYAYQAPSVGYEAELRLGGDGFVDLYPDLWIREPAEIEKT